MAVKYSKPKGTLDVLPTESWKWQYVENKMRDVARRYGYGEIRLPTFEDTALYTRGVGEGTDIVSKEMYTFEDKGGRSITLRPEGTAGVVRAVLENGLLASSPLPLKSYYIESHFRYEKAQKGRYREHHQFGIECFATREAAADAEVISVAHSLLREFGLAAFSALHINSIGCPKCRPAYHEKLRQYFKPHLANMCEDCLTRFQNNPLRLLDCKEESCKAFTKDAPIITDNLCEDCANHFSEVQAILTEGGIAFAVNPGVVRGLDYYSNTVFEFVAEGVGTQGTVCGGGRYDGLIAELGGPATPAVGFGLGIERFLMLLEENDKLPAAPGGPALYAVALGGEGRAAARKLVAALRGEGLSAECDLMNRSLKAQMKAAGRLGALYTVAMGDDELASGIVKLKRMRDGAEAELPLVGAVGAIKHVLQEDPGAHSDEDLEILVESYGPVVSFGNEAAEE